MTKRQNKIGHRGRTEDVNHEEIPPDEYARLLKAIQATWSPAMRRKREGYPAVPSEIHELHFDGRSYRAES